MSVWADFLSLDDLDSWEDSSARGRALEGLVAKLFRRSHFAVTENSQVATPRQTDLFVVKLNDRYLVECKWLNKPATIEDLDSLRNRLGRTSADVIGILISMGGFSKEVLNEVRLRRREPVLLFSSEELRQAEQSPQLLLDLLYRKREALSQHAEVLLDQPRQLRRTAELPYPRSPKRFRSVAGVESQVTEFAGGFSSTAFVDSVTDVDWTTSLGRGVSFDVELPVLDEADVITALNTMVDLGWVTGGGRWSIQQLSREWHGLGIESLMEELPRWEHRVEHHSEQFLYVDNCDGGFYTFHADLGAHRQRMARRASLSFLLDGVPLDPAPWQQLCRTLGVHEGLRFRPLDHPGVSTVLFTPRHDRERVDVTVAGWIVGNDWRQDDDPEGWATGVLIANPFHPGNATAIAPPEGAASLTEGETLICTLKQHHPIADVQDNYFLSRIEWAWTADAFICSPQVDWPYEPKIVRPHR